MGAREQVPPRWQGPGRSRQELPGVLGWWQDHPQALASSEEGGGSSSVCWLLAPHSLTASQPLPCRFSDWFVTVSGWRRTAR